MDLIGQRGCPIPIFFPGGMQKVCSQAGRIGARYSGMRGDNRDAGPVFQSINLFISHSIDLLLTTRYTTTSLVVDV